MPVCPRCGKLLSSEQALSYHLNKKYKCGTWKCLNCHDCFDSKFQLTLHEMNCYDVRVEVPSYDVLRMLYLYSKVIVLSIDNKRITSISPNCEHIIGYSQAELIGKSLEDVPLEEVMTTWTNKNGILLNSQRYKIPKLKNFYMDQFLCF